MNVYEITTDESWNDATGGGLLVVRIRSELSLRDLYSEACQFSNPERVLFVEMCEPKSTSKGKKWTPWAEAAIPLSNVRRMVKVKDEE